MTLTLSVKHLPNQVGRDAPVHVEGLLWIDAAEVKLLDSNGEEFVPIVDPLAFATLKAALPPGDFCGKVLMQAWIRRGPSGTELCNVFWVVEILELATGPWTFGPTIPIRPVPPEYDCER